MVLCLSFGIKGGGAETLEDVLAAAYATNPGLQASRAQLRSVDEGVRQARAGWFPTVNVTGNVGRGRYHSTTLAHTDTIRNPESYSVTLSQPLYTGGQTLAGIDQAENNVLASRAQLHASEQSVLLGAATAFLDIIRDEALVEQATNHVRVLQRQVEAVRARFAGREATQTDVGQAEARLAQAEAGLTQAEGALQDSRAIFTTVIGRPPEAPTVPSAARPVPGNLEEVRGTIERQNPNIMAAVFNVQAAKAGVVAAEGQLLPTVSLNGTNSRGLNESTAGGYSSTQEVKLTLSVPLYDGGANYSRVRGQKETLMQRSKEAEQARREAVQNGSRAWQALRSARAKVTSFTTQIRANETALRGVIEEQRVGSRTVLDVLNAEQELFTARQSLVTARHDEMVSAFQLYASMGRMTVRELGIATEVYDPTVHYEEVRGKMFGLGGSEE
ncbi:TolC family outer membrane protein [Magnetospirillum moscoviense]|uniref:Type I secretion protein TolC n=1 Tax=Magnetospirillum moscoviense TaxID=1437059 RepID=A0A178MG68_9PROT|nr:TolC family outer membrane protein [Magnetospirillum moscoviense]MBF0325792.1 TolC family outer membrane protein [Alphaproteobacteria bacterium]OAN47137.1 hypothetical protein A6A05_15835 [Magnetospirillum moscoviense]